MASYMQGLERRGVKERDRGEVPTHHPPTPNDAPPTHCLAEGTTHMVPHAQLLALM